MKKIFSFFFILLLTNSVFAKNIETPYLDLSVPDDYQCTSETGRYVCQNQSGPKQKESILTMVFKRSGPKDALDQYQDYLNHPMSRVSKSGPPALSKVISVNQIKIGDWDWVEGKHFESEIPNYTTYYWATVRAPVAMIVTFSVEKNREGLHEAEIKMIRDTLHTKGVQFSPAEEEGVNPQAAISGTSAIGNNSPNSKLILGQKPAVLIAGILAALVLLVLLIRR